MLSLLVAFTFWAVVHSLTAGARFKAYVRRHLGDQVYAGTYRMLYNVLSLITLLPIFYLLSTRVPERVLWSIPSPFRLLNYGVMIGGVVGLLISLWQTDVWSFLGLRQLAEILRRDRQPHSEPVLVVAGTYALVRHPLYLFSLMFLWADPVLTLQSLLLNTWVTVYFIIGSYYEEKRLRAIFGESYRVYQERVPRLIPLRLSVYSALLNGK